MKRILIAAAAVFLLAAPIAEAQQPGPGMHHADRQGDQRRPRLSAEDRAAFLDARLAAMKAGIKLTPAQEPLWTPLEAAVRDVFTDMADEREERRAERREARAEGERRDPIERLRERAERLSERAANLKKLADAAEPLYKSLDDKQKRRLRILMRADRWHGPRRARG